MLLFYVFLSGLSAYNLVNNSFDSLNNKLDLMLL